MSSPSSSPISVGSVVPMNADIDASRTGSRSVDVLVVGAGISGLTLLKDIIAKDPKADVLCVEAGERLGGTWNWNRYPGARCDVLSYQYQYQGDSTLATSSEWSERFAAQPEILKYLDGAAERWNVKERIQFNTKVNEARWNEDHSRWLVMTSKGRISARMVIMATGCLSVPTNMQYPGQEKFKGKILRTHDWPSEPIDWSNLRVGVVGTGSSGVQTISAIAKSTKSLTVFQRTASYVGPARNSSHSPEERIKQRDESPKVRDYSLTLPFSFEIHSEARPYSAFSPDEWKANLEQRWQSGWFDIMGACADFIMNEEANVSVGDFIRGKIDEMVHDKVKAEILKPKQSLLLGCKRFILSDTYYEAFNMPHVSIVSIESNPITEVIETGLKLADGTVHELDVLIWATGFDAMTGALTKGMKIRGRNDVELNEIYSAGPRTYLGLMTPDMPNMLVCAGPGSPSVLSNMVIQIESHSIWIADLLADMKAKQRSVVECAPEASDVWTATINAIVGMLLVGSPKCNSWYWGSNVPGKTRAYSVFIGGWPMYAAKLKEVTEKDYEGFRFA